MAEIATSGHRRLTPDNKSSRDLNEVKLLRASRKSESYSEGGGKKSKIFGAIITSLGYGDVVINGRVRLIAPLQAIAYIALLLAHLKFSIPASGIES